MKKLSLMKSKKYAIYAKKSFAMIKIKKVNMNFIIKLEIIVTTPENLQESVIIFLI